MVVLIRKENKLQVKLMRNFSFKEILNTFKDFKICELYKISSITLKQYSRIMIITEVIHK